MGNLVYALPVIGCAVMMGAMMWMMMRGNHAGMGQQPPPGSDVREEMQALRAELAALRHQQDSDTDRAATHPTP